MEEDGGGEGRGIGEHGAEEGFIIVGAAFSNQRRHVY